MSVYVGRVRSLSGQYLIPKGAMAAADPTNAHYGTRTHSHTHTSTAAAAVSGTGRRVPTTTHRRGSDCNPPRDGAHVSPAQNSIFSLHRGTPTTPLHRRRVTGTDNNWRQFTADCRRVSAFLFYAVTVRDCFPARKSDKKKKIKYIHTSKR